MEEWKAGLLDRLSERSSFDRLAKVNVTARLYPDAELAVSMQDRAPCPDHQRGRRQMERIGVLVERTL
jgi:hypothetical protein